MKEYVNDFEFHSKCGSHGVDSAKIREYIKSKGAEDIAADVISEILCQNLMNKKPVTKESIDDCIKTFRSRKKVRRYRCKLGRKVTIVNDYDGLRNMIEDAIGFSEGNCEGNSEMAGEIAFEIKSADAGRRFKIKKLSIEVIEEYE